MEGGEETAYPVDVGRGGATPGTDGDVDGDHRMEGGEETAYPVDGVECLIEPFKALRIDAGQ
jgi:hypothetical protein